MRKVILTILAVALPASAFWPAGGVKVVQTPEAISNPQMVYINDGSVVISWEADRLIYCQKLDTTGVIHWDAGGIRVCLSDSNQRDHHMVTDGQDAYFVWRDYRNDDGDIYAQKLSGSTGQRLWGEQGVPACVKTGQQYVCDGAILDNGDFAATWFNLIADPYAVEAQRLDANGEAQWDLEGVLVSGQSIGGTPKVLPSGNALLDVWTGIRVGDTSGAYLAQRIDSGGNFLWDTLGVLIEYALSFEGVCSDEAGGAIVLFSKGPEPYYAQRVDSSGQNLWQEGGVPIQINQSMLSVNNLESPAPTGESERFISDGMGGLFIHHGELVQHVDSSGTLVWSNPGVAFWERSGGNTFMDDPNQCLDGDEGIFVVFSTIGDPDYLISPGIFVQRIRASGEVMFGTKGVTVWLGTNDFSDISTSIGEAVPGGVICVWLDSRNTPDVSLYAQFVDTTGKVGSGIVEELPSTEQLNLEAQIDIASTLVSFQYSLPPNETGRLRVFDATGRLILSQKITQSKGIVTWDVTSTPCGVYFAQLVTTNNARVRRKLVLIK